MKTQQCSIDNLTLIKYPSSHLLADVNKNTTKAIKKTHFLLKKVINYKSEAATEFG